VGAPVSQADKGSRSESASEPELFARKTVGPVTISKMIREELTCAGKEQSPEKEPLPIFEVGGTDQTPKKKRRKRNPWNEKFNMLRSYQERTGHCDVHRHESSMLRDWCYNFRRILRKIDISRDKKSRIQQLNSIGFDWGADPPFHCLPKSTGNLQQTSEAAGSNNDQHRSDDLQNDEVEQEIGRNEEVEQQQTSASDKNVSSMELSMRLPAEMATSLSGDLFDFDIHGPAAQQANDSEQFGKQDDGENTRDTSQESENGASVENRTKTSMESSAKSLSDLPRPGRKRKRKKSSSKRKKGCPVKPIESYF
jgi:hypothetical protein